MESLDCLPSAKKTDDVDNSSNNCGVFESPFSNEP